MGINRKRHRKFYLTKAVKAFVKNPYFLLISVIISILTAVYNWGRANKGAEKDKEIQMIITEHHLRVEELNRIHREELREMDNIIQNIEQERDLWKEKYFLRIQGE